MQQGYSTNTGTSASQAPPLTFACSYEAVEDVLQVTDLYDPRTQWASYIVNALKVGLLLEQAAMHEPAPLHWRARKLTTH